MNNLFDSFQSVDLAQWEAQLFKDLKGQSEDLLKRVDPIEGLTFTTYQHPQSKGAQSAQAFSDKYARGLQRETNTYFNVRNIFVTSEKEANEEALLALNNGANALRFENVETKDLTLLLKDVQLAYIQIRIVEPTIEQIEWITKEYSSLLGTALLIEIDPVQRPEIVQQLFPVLKEKQFPVFCSNGYALHQLGASLVQEITFSLSVAHDAVCSLMEQGFTIDQAVACIHFSTSAGSKYFYEIAKVRTLRMLWTRIVERYSPESPCSKNSVILGLTGFVNKSLKDPHTNLLRQTTEVSSLILGGADSICCVAHDTFNRNGASVLAKRMALNIPNIVLEESYFDKVIDPYAGSYAVEAITNEMATQAWDQFTALNEEGGFHNKESISLFIEEVLSKRQARINAYLEGNIKFIGINSFPNPDQQETCWDSPGNYLGIDYLVYESIED